MTIKNSFVGRVIKIDKSKNDNIYIFEIQKTLKGNLKGIVKIYSEISGCGTTFTLNDTFLVTTKTHALKNYTSHCDLGSQIHDKTFSLDTSFIINCTKKNVVFSFPEFSGELKNGLKQGIWRYYSIEATISNDSNYLETVITYDKGKPIGERYKYYKKKITEKTIYNKGKWTESISYKNDTINEINYLDGTVKKLYPNGKLHQIMFNKHGKGYFLKYNQDGQVIQKVPFDKKGYVCGYIIDYKPDGTIKNETLIEKNTEHRKWHYWD